MGGCGLLIVHKCWKGSPSRSPQGSQFQNVWIWNIRICWPSSSTRMITSLWPSEAIWHHKNWSTLVHVMAWCLIEPCHYINQCWLIISEIMCHSFGHFHRKYLRHHFIRCVSKPWDVFQKHASKISAIFFFTWDQYWPPGVIVACVCLSIRSSPSLSAR